MPKRTKPIGIAVPVASVHKALDGGVRACPPLRPGGKVGPMPGQPLAAQCIVPMRVSGQLMRGLAGNPVALGDTAMVQVTVSRWC